MAFLDALLGALLNHGSRLNIPKGINFSTGLLARPNSTTGYVDVTVAEGSLAPENLAPGDEGRVVPWAVTVEFEASGAAGTLIDVTLFEEPPIDGGFRIKRADLRLEIGHASDSALRTATGGAGSVIMPDASSTSRTFLSTAVGRRSDNAAAEHDYTAGEIHLRIDRSCAGSVTLWVESL